MTLNTADDRLANMGSPRRVWAVSAIHAESERLIDLHDWLFERVMPGDRVVYHGNYAGVGPQPVETIDEILTFRRMILALPAMLPSDIVYLRGGQEEMWQKLLQIQFAPNPPAVLEWILSKGLAATLRAYGISPEAGLCAAREGVMSLTKWTNTIRAAIRRHAGHDTFLTHWKQAAYTSPANPHPLLFVHAGIDPARALPDQGDNFWWAGQNFSDMVLPYDPFEKVIRGYDPAHQGLHLNCVTATIDGGCGYGGALVCAGFDDNGVLFDLLEA